MAITFDDGYENWYTLAFPIIKKLKVPVSFFISTNQANYSFLWSDFIDIASKESNTWIILDETKFDGLKIISDPNAPTLSEVEANFFIKHRQNF